MKITFSIVIWNKDADSQNRYPIAIRICGGGKRTYYNTGIKIHKDDRGKWENAGMVYQQGTEEWQKDYNYLLGKVEGLKKEIEVRKLRSQNVTIQDAKLILNPSPRISGDFISFFGSQIKYIKATKSSGYYKHYLVEFREFKKFCGGKLPFAKVTAVLLEDYEIYLQTMPNGVKRKNTTLNTKTRRIRQIIEIAINRELIKKSQVLGYKVPVYKAPQRNYLTIEQIRELERMVYEGELDHSLTDKIVASFFLVECHSGIRFSDWNRFEIEKLLNGRNFKVRAQKNDSPVYLSLEIFTSLARIVDFIKENNYNFNITEQATNRILKYLPFKKEHKPTFPLTTHVGRHTFGTMLGEKGYSTAKIAEAMGISENVAKVYVHQTRKGFNDEASRLGGW